MGGNGVEEYGMPKPQLNEDCLAIGYIHEMSYNTEEQQEGGALIMDLFRWGWG